MHTSPRRAIEALTVAVLCATTLSAAAPPPVSEGSAVDACRDAVESPQQACDAVSKFVQGAAEGCRTLTGELAECGVLNGQPINDEQVERYRDSWVAVAHDLQRRLQDDVPLRDATFIATHNSYNGYGEDPTLSRLDANQSYGLVQQLDMDVRRLELDVHWWYSLDHPDGHPTTCHGTDEPNVLGDPFTRHTGCTTEDGLEHSLRQIRSWLGEHPDEVIMLRFETHLEDAQKQAVAAGLLDEHLGDVLYRPSHRRPEAHGCTALDLDITRNEVRATATGSGNAQVIAVGDCGFGDPSWNALVFDDGPVRRESTYRGQDFSFPTCDGWTEASLAEHWVRYYDDQTLVSSLASLGGEAPLRATPEIAEQWIRCGVNQPAFDHLTPTDGRLEAMVWTFDAADLGPARAGDCAVVTPDGRLGAVPCRPSARPHVVCRDTHGILSVRPGASGRACGPSATFDTPRNGREALVLGQELANLGIGQATVDLRHADGHWTD